MRGRSVMKGEEFVKGLGLWDAVNIVAGGMIGSGIFVVSQSIAVTTGAPGWLLMVWALTGIMTLSVALTYGEWAAMFPHAGGQYVYLKEAFSPLFGFLYGWTSFLVIQTGTIAAVAVAFAKYLGVFFPEVSQQVSLVEGVQFNIYGAHIHLGLSSAQAVACSVIAVLTAINCLHLHVGKIVQNFFTTAKLLSLLSLVVIGIFVLKPESAWTSTDWFQRQSGGDWSSLPLFAAFWTAMVGSSFSADAWNNITFVAGEVRNPQKNLPLSLIFGAGGVVLLYFLVNISYLRILPFESIAHAPEQRVAAVAMQALVPGGAMILAALVMVSTFGCLNGIILAGPRLYWAMAKDGLFFKKVGELNRNHVPQNGLVYQGLWAMLLTITGAYNDLLDYVIFAALLFYLLTVVGLFAYRKKDPHRERPYRALGYPVIPALYVLLSLTMMGVLLIYKPLYTWPGIFIVASGIPVYYKVMQKK